MKSNQSLNADIKITWLISFKKWLKKNLNEAKNTVYPKILECYGKYGVNVGKIVRRIIKYAPPYCLQGLSEIKILDKDPDDIGFASYNRQAGKIELYIDDIIGWQPWFLRKSYVFPYIAICVALGHEIDHHVNRTGDSKEQEKSAERNALKYVYPSFGVFKPVAKFFSFLLKMKRT